MRKVKTVLKWILGGLLFASFIVGLHMLYSWVLSLASVFCLQSPLERLFFF